MWPASKCLGLISYHSLAGFQTDSPGARRVTDRRLANAAAHVTVTAAVAQPCAVKCWAERAFTSKTQPTRRLA